MPPRKPQPTPSNSGLRGIGVRIEDDIVITEDGYEILSDKLPREADEVEAWMTGLLA